MDKVFAYKLMVQGSNPGWNNGHVSNLYLRLANSMYENAQLISSLGVINKPLNESVRISTYRKGNTTWQFIMLRGRGLTSHIYFR